MVRMALYYGFFILCSVGVHFAVILPRRAAEGTPERVVAVAQIIDQARTIQEQILAAQAAANAAIEAIDEAPAERPTPPKPTPPKPTPPKETVKADPIDQEPEQKEDPRIQDLLRASEAQRREVEAMRKAQADAAARSETERQQAQKQREALAARVKAQEARQRELEAENRRLAAQNRELAKKTAELLRDNSTLEKRAKLAEAQALRAARVVTTTRNDATARLKKLERDRAAERARLASDARRREQLALERAAAEQVRRRAAERALARERQTFQSKEKTLVKRLEGLEDWSRYRRAARAKTIDADRVPVLNFPESLRRPEDFFDLMRFYGMEVIVYPPATRRFLAHVNVDSGKIQEIRDPRSYLAGYSRRSLRQLGETWRPLRRRVAERFRASPETLGVYTVFPRKTASYFAWKQLTAIQRAGLDPKKVVKCYGRYRRASGGQWVVDITTLETRDGQQHRLR